MEVRLGAGCGGWCSCGLGQVVGVLHFGQAVVGSGGVGTWGRFSWVVEVRLGGGWRRGGLEQVVMIGGVAA